MIATFTALLFAHIVADFLLQTRGMVKHKRHAGVLLLHTALVLASAQAATGQTASAILIALAAAHLIIDAIKTFGGFRSFTAFCVDQGAHVITIAIVAIYAPEVWTTGAWASTPALLPVMAVLTGIIATLSAGQHAIALLMHPYRNSIRSNGLRDGGRLIGLLERGLIFLFILTGHPIGVGFLIGAKSILRFGTATRDQRTAEYVIIGTLASFGWAICCALLTLAAVQVLTPLEITIPKP